MDKVIGERLGRALVSGEWRQGRTYLKRGRRYDPLGVLSELYMRSTGKRVSIDSVLIIPKEVLDWAGLSAGEARRLSNLSDGGVGFDTLGWELIREVKMRDKIEPTNGGAHD